MVRANGSNNRSDDVKTQIVITDLRLSERERREYAAQAAKRATEIMSEEDWKELRARASDPLKADIDMICRDDAEIYPEGSK